MWQRFFRSGDMTRVRQRRGLSSLAQRKYEGADARHGDHRKCYIVTSHGLHQCVSAEAECHVTDGRAAADVAHRLGPWPQRRGPRSARGV